MQRQHLVVLTVGLAILSAGCIGITDNNNNNTPPSTLTADDLNTSANTIESAQSYNITLSRDTFEKQTTRYQYNKTQNRKIVIESVEGRKTNERYLTANQTYRRNAGVPAVEEGGISNNTAAVAVANSLEMLSQNMSTINRTKTTTFNGQTVGVYTVSGNEAKQIDETYDRVTFYATTDGVVVYTLVSGDVDGREFTLEFSVTGLNNTTVQEPSWVPEDSEQEAAPPRAGVSFETVDNGTKVRATVTDPGNVERLRIETAGTRAGEGDTATITDPEAGDTATIIVSTRGDTVDSVRVVGVNKGEEGVVATYDIP